MAAAAYSFASEAAKEKAETVAARPPYSGYVFIDSKQRREGEKISSITVRDSVFETNYVSEVVPASFKMFWGVPNITPRNNGLRVIVGPGIEDATRYVPPGWYDASKLADALNIAFGGGDILFESEESLPGIGNGIRITSPTGPVRLLPPAGASGSILDAVGLAPMSSFVDTNVAPIVAFGCPLPYTRYFDVCAEQLHADSVLRDEVSNRSHSSVLFRVWINKAEPHALEHDPRTVKAIKVSPDRILSYLGVRLVDEYGEELYLPENCGHNFSIRLVVIGGQPRQP